MRLSLRAKINLYVSLSIIGITVISSSAFFLKYRSELDTNITARLTIGAHLAMECIDMGLVPHLRDEGFTGSEPNLKVLGKLKIIEKNFGFSSVYLCVRENAKTVFAFDSGDYQATEDLSFLSAYDEAPPPLGEAFASGQTTGAEYSDRWGPTRSVFVPVKDLSGNVTGVVGADFSMADVRSVMRRAYLLLAGVIAVGIALSALVIWLLRLSFTGPIVRIISDISSISEDMDLSRRMPVRRNDELGLLGEKFNAFLHQSAENVRHIEETSAILALSSNELSEISAIFTSTTQVQAESTAEAAETISRITTLIHRIVTLSGQQLEIFSSQRLLIGELYAGIQSVNGQAEHAMTLSSDVSSRAKDGEVSLSTMNQSMDKVMKSSEDMIGIIGIINDISDRINLLSLNAAIEAARAGEAGRGFAVVADEVSKLAEQTASSTKNIDSLIRANSDEISREIESLNATTSVLREIIAGVENMRDEMQTIHGATREQLETAETVRQNAGNIFARAEEIKGIADDQKNELDTITGLVQDIENNMRGVICGSEEIAANSHDIADTAMTLKQNISVFKF